MSSVCLLFGGLVVLSGQAQEGETVFSDQTTLQEKPAYTPGIKWGGISLDDSEFYEIPPEKCAASSVGELVGVYFLTDKVYIFKTEAGYGVAELEISLRDLETGVRRGSGFVKNQAGAACRLDREMKIEGDLDCRGERMIKASPYDGCAYEAKIWAHSLSKEEAFNLVYQKLQIQFIDYKDKCVLPAQPQSLRKRMEIF